jgi:protein TonB
MPQFPGGDEARVKYMVENVKYPETSKDKGVQGSVYVSFVVEKDGRITNTKVIRGVEKSLDAEAFRVVSAMPKWIPGSEKGKPVRVQFNMPIQFKLK